MIITKYQLMTAIFTGGGLDDEGGVVLDVTNAVEREDGGGRNFNVTGYRNGRIETVFIRTLD